MGGACRSYLALGLAVGVGSSVDYTLDTHVPGPGFYLYLNLAL